MSSDPSHDAPAEARIRSPTDDAVAAAADALRRGDLVGMPTETVYGLACHALDDRAVARVFAAKGRPRFDPLIVHCDGTAEAENHAAVWPGVARRLADAFWPGPLTIVVPKRVGGDAAIGDLVTSGLPTVALRVPSHPVARRLIDAAGVPLAAPSANRFGRVSPTRARHVVDELGGCDALACVLDGGPCTTGVESTVISCVDDDPVVLRLGGVTLEELADALGFTPRGAARDTATTNDAEHGRASPGMLSKHYAPTTPLRLVDSLDAVADERMAQAPAERSEAGGGAAVLAFQHLPPDLQPRPHEILSETGDPVEAAAHLFVALRRLDAAGAATILAERAPDAGLGRAINDRLERAAT